MQNGYSEELQVLFLFNDFSIAFWVNIIVFFVFFLYRFLIHFPLNRFWGHIGNFGRTSH